MSFSSGRAGEERGRGDDNRRSCACGSCDGPRHVAHVQVQGELKKKKRERESRGLKRENEHSRLEGGLTTNIFNRAKNVCRVA